MDHVRFPIRSLCKHILASRRCSQIAEIAFEVTLQRGWPWLTIV